MSKRPIVWLDPDPLTVEPDELWDPVAVEWVPRPPESERGDFWTGVVYAMLAWLAGLLLGLFIAHQAVAAPRSAANVIPTVASGSGMPGASAPASSGNPSQPSGAPLGPSPSAGGTRLNGAPLEAYEGGRTGTIAWADESLGPRYLAVPIGPGHRVRICSARCVVMVSTDAGPNRERLQAGRIADLAVGVWERVCGLPRSAGLCLGSWTVVRSIATPPATDR